MEYQTNLLGRIATFRYQTRHGGEKHSQVEIVGLREAEVTPIVSDKGFVPGPSKRMCLTMIRDLETGRVIENVPLRSLRNVRGQHSGNLTKLQDTVEHRKAGT